MVRLLVEPDSPMYTSRHHETDCRNLYAFFPIVNTTKTNVSNTRLIPLPLARCPPAPTCNTLRGLSVRLASTRCMVANTCRKADVTDAHASVPAWMRCQCEMSTGFISLC